MKPKEKSSKIIFKCPYFEVEEKKLVYPNGYKHDYYVENGNDFVVVICEKDDKILMVKQYRVPLEGVSLEFPAGGIKDEEDKDTAAKRELEEETGYAVDKLKFLGSVKPLIARSSVTGHVYHAKITDEEPKELNLDPSELGLESVWVHKKYIQHMIKTSDTLDSITVSSWVFFRERS